MQDGEKLLAEHGSAEAKVRPRLRELKDSWDLLTHNCKEKKARLQEAHQVRPLTSHLHGSVRTYRSARKVGNGFIITAVQLVIGAIM